MHLGYVHPNKNEFKHILLLCSHEMYSRNVNNHVLFLNRSSFKCFD